MPGVLVRHADAQATTIHVLTFDESTCHEAEVTDVAQVATACQRPGITWVDVNGVEAAHLIAELGELFGLHPLSLEDAISLHQRPKVEAYGSYLFIVALMVHADERIQTEQLSIFLGANFVLTFQEFTADYLTPVRNRLRESAGRIRHLGPDYLAYAILDVVIDGYFPPLDQLADKLDLLEEQVEGVAKSRDPGTARRSQ